MPVTFRRFKSDPIPAVHPTWEYLATGDLTASYEAYKRQLQIPWVGVVTMAYAHYQTVFKTWWTALEEVTGTQEYVDKAMVLRAQIEKRVEELSPPPMRQRLLDMGYSERELNEILDMMEVITHGNFMQIPAVFLLPMMLEGIEPGDKKQLSANAKPHRPDITTPFILIEPHHALSDVQAIYADIRATLGLPFVNTDYRCFARWPSYFEKAWQDLRPHIDTKPYEAIVLDMHQSIAATALDLPNPTGLRAQDIMAAANQDATVEEVLNATRLFAWLLPGLVTNVAYWRAQLLA